MHQLLRNQIKWRRLNLIRNRAALISMALLVNVHSFLKIIYWIMLKYVYSSLSNIFDLLCDLCTIFEFFSKYSKWLQTIDPGTSNYFVILRSTISRVRRCNILLSFDSSSSSLSLRHCSSSYFLLLIMNRRKCISNDKYEDRVIRSKWNCFDIYNQLKYYS